ncbi:MAG: hypothetical protein ACYSWP_15900 [Planctomycetota bacterium]|jgi:hypothetical protein
MKLTVKERIILLGVMPKEGDFKTLKQIREARESLSFDDHENKALNFVTDPNGNVRWSEPGAEDGEFYTKDIEISDTVMEIIVAGLKALDEQKKLNTDTFEIYERFVEGKSE